MGSNSRPYRHHRFFVATAEVAIVLLASTTTLAAPPLIDVSVAPLYVGEEVTVEARVNAGRREGNVVRLQLGQPPATIELLLVEGLLSRFPDAERQLIGQTIRASGTIREFRGRWEMVVRDPQNIATLGQSLAAPEAKAPQATVQSSPGLTPEQHPSEVRLQALEARLDRLEKKLAELEQKPVTASQHLPVSPGDSFEDRLRKLEIRLRHMESGSPRRP